MHRRDDEKDQGPGLAGLSPLVSGPPGPTVIQFPRRAHTAAFGGSAAGGDPPSSPASFESLGSVTQAVVLRVANNRVRLKVAAGPREEEEEDRQR